MTTRDEFLHDVLVTAVEEGIQYWAQVREYYWSGGLHGNWEARVQVQVRGEQEWRQVDHNTLSAGLERAYSEPALGWLWERIGDAARSNDAGELDDALCDAILQVGLFGDVLFR